MASLVNKRILVGVTGGIACYKGVDLVRRLHAAGVEVRVAMTRNAQQFVTPLSFQAVSGAPVHIDLFDPTTAAGMDHIDLARWPHLVLIAPASANFLARLAHGLADDLLTTTCLATTAPIALAPAMNQAMWSNAATQANVALLGERGIRQWGPDSGDQACGDVGAGRMLEPDALVAQCATLFNNDRLAGVRVVVTAGPTYESLDPVRGITNRSSGKMGFALAIAAADAGARVKLVSGPSALAPPPHIETLRVRSAEEMWQAVQGALPCDLFIAAAAVADYRPAQIAASKIKKSAEHLRIDLIKNPDILALVAAQSPRPFCVGFAAETDDLIRNARRKLMQKKLDLVAANLVGGADSGLESNFNSLVLVDHRGELTLPRATKAQLAQQLIEHIVERYREKYQTENSRPAHRH